MLIKPALLDQNYSKNSNIAIYYYTVIENNDFVF